MEKANVIALLEKYWRAETTVEEEKALGEWFNAQAPGSLDPDLEPCSALFAYFDEEAQVSPGPDFEARILQAIAPDQKATPVRHFHWGIISAAAAILVVVISLFLLQTPEKGRKPTAVAQVKDTFDNPDQALAAVRHALLIASVHLNEGRKQITNK